MPKSKEKVTHTSPPSVAVSPQSTLRHVAFVCLTAILAGLATYFARNSTARAPIASLPESYALCTDSGKIYTVDEQSPAVDCILVRSDRIEATGSLGALYSLHYRLPVFLQYILGHSLLCARAVFKYEIRRSLCSGLSTLLLYFASPRSR